ncbi:hypothetical protein HK100_003285 [Physocladia obscura]|uniref:Uncharacterized protein n=1 Tax=Physocladia obscura TaxID=109957 RepID=A0AAD5T071_9FUNG|nr:hypothetical protein HK100_003285 [Physocladia obscura]
MDVLALTFAFFHCWSFVAAEGCAVTGINELPKYAIYLGSLENLNIFGAPSPSNWTISSSLPSITKILTGIANRPPFNTANPICSYAPFLNYITVLNGDSSKGMTVIHVFDVGEQAWTVVPASASSSDIPNVLDVVASLDHDTNVIYAFSNGYWWDGHFGRNFKIKLLGDANLNNLSQLSSIKNNTAALSWIANPTVNNQPFNGSGYKAVFGQGTNHLHFLNAPGLKTGGDAWIFVIHYAWWQLTAQSYGSFPKSSGGQIVYIPADQSNNAPSVFALKPLEISKNRNMLLKTVAVGLFSAASVAAIGCVITDLSLNLYVFGAPYGDVNLGADPTVWTASTAPASATQLSGIANRPAFDTANPTCSFSPFYNYITVLNGDSSLGLTVLHVFSTLNQTWTKVPLTGTSIPSSNLVASMDHDTSVIYAYSDNTLYRIDYADSLGGTLSTLSLQWLTNFNNTPQPFDGSAYTSPVFGQGTNHLHFLNVPGAAAGLAYIFVVHYAWWQPTSQSYGSFPQSAGQSVYIPAADQTNAPSVFAFLPDDGSATYLVDTVANSTTTLTGFGSSGAAFRYAATSSNIIQLDTTTGDLKVLPVAGGSVSAGTGVALLPSVSVSASSASATSTSKGLASASTSTTTSTGKSASLANYAASAFMAMVAAIAVNVLLA